MKTTTKEDKSSLAALLKESGFDLPPTQLDALWRFHLLLGKSNEALGLTRITDFREVAIKHYVDSLMPTNFMQLPSKLLDIGTGAGFPGIPLKILRPEMELILGEHRPKRVAFLKSVCKELSLTKVGLFTRKVTPESFHAEVQGVITRAVEEIGETLIRVERILAVGGVAIFLKGPTADVEIEAVEKDPEFRDHYRLSLDQAYALPILGHERRLIVYERLASF